MEISYHNPASIYPAAGPYAHGVMIEGAQRLLFVSGTMGLTPDGEALNSFEAQCEQAWSNIRETLKTANMDFTNLIKVTCFLCHPSHRAVNAEIRARVLGNHKVAVTVMGATLLESAWLLEIEAIAAC